MQINNGLSPDMGMFVVAPAATFLHHHSGFNGGQPQHYHSQSPSGFIGFDGGSTPALGVGVGVIPLAADDLFVNTCNRGRGNGGGFQLWQNQQASAAVAAADAAEGYNSPRASVTDNDYTKKGNEAGVELQHTQGSTCVDRQEFPPVHGGGNGIECVGFSSSAAAATCQDCGNQAKKDCIHQRCRTCCKNRGLPCSTHVKSTWVPAARRRERHLYSNSAVTASCSQSASSGAKKPRLVLGNQSQTSHTSTSNNTAATATTGDSGGGSMPKQVTAPAEFRCVRVSPMDGGEDDEYAFQAVVRIGGHVFKGFLYDQGLDPGESSGKAVNRSEQFNTATSPPIVAASSESHDIYGGDAATSAEVGMLGIGGSNFGLGNLFQ
ncbi:unnamed protein product [Cuscuta epithymum]|uniref:Uncharacterized protein n=1 Tax=Cuscuta epithymum TaxID=186058 RepID=A0AAV0E2U0_9ASTE|nr:unnamed protein product [Cuscuta epithymum]